jgi:hypothetical protein
MMENTRARRRGRRLMRARWWSFGILCWWMGGGWEKGRREKVRI